MIVIDKPEQAEHSQYFGKYIELVDEGDALHLLEANKAVIATLFGALSDEEQKYRYAADKWTPKEILSHIIDTERGMCYRAMCVARGDTQNLPYMDEDLFAKNAHANDRSMKSLVTEYEFVRAATLTLFRDSIPADKLALIGTVNNYPMSPRALAWIIAGHEIHHVGILRERYLHLDA